MLKADLLFLSDRSKQAQDVYLSLLGQSKDLYFGIYIDIDNATGDENGYAGFIHTNDDDVFGLDEETGLVSSELNV